MSYFGNLTLMKQDFDNDEPCRYVPYSIQEDKIIIYRTDRPFKLKKGEQLQDIHVLREVDKENYHGWVKLPKDF